MDLRKEEAILAQRLDDATERGRVEGKVEGIKIGEERGKAEGRKAEKIEVAKNLLKAGIPIKIISQTTGLTVDEIKGST